jgi:hypothetical protein
MAAALTTDVLAARHSIHAPHDADAVEGGASSPLFALRGLPSPKRPSRKMGGPMPGHRFVVGQWVRLATSPSLSRKVAESYRITRMLPERDNSPQYRLVSEDGLHERVVMEDGIESTVSPAEVPSAD